MQIVLTLKMVEDYLAMYSATEEVGLAEHCEKCLVAKVILSTYPEINRVEVNYDTVKYRLKGDKTSFLKHTYYMPIWAQKLIARLDEDSIGMSSFVPIPKYRAVEELACV